MTLVRCDGVAVVMPVRDRADLLDRALTALASSLRDVDAVLVVDSASRTSDVEGVAAAHAVPCVRVDAPGISRARNAGCDAVDAPIIAFTDDDCRPHPGWTAAYDRAFAARPELAFAFGRVEPAEGPGVPVSVLEGDDPYTVHGSRPGQRLGHGANMAFRRDALDRAGPFDEALGVGGPLRAAEDTDMFLRLLAAGASGAYLPDAVVVHDRRPTRRSAAKAAYGYGIGEGALAVKHARTGIGGSGSPARAALRQTVDDLRAGYATGVAVGVARTAGAVVGARRVRDWPIRDGCFVA